MGFEFFDPARVTRITAGTLPHWYQPGVTYFVTFRTDDSMPIAVADLWRRRRDDWLRRHAINPRASRWQAQLRNLPETQQDEFQNTFAREYLDYLDRGQGACVLKKPEMAKIVVDALRHFDGSRYLLGDLVIMPNHVHLLACLLGETDLEAQCYSWKKFTATRINRALAGRGRFWHEESFDHLVRSTEQFEHLRRYIADNPRKAALRENEYLHWRRA
jgi:putative transposase